MPGGVSLDEGGVELGLLGAVGASWNEAWDCSEFVAGERCRVSSCRRVF
jgi:hypothetical protein